jgi:polyhydroxyalkanoate synthesis regulator phasin
MATVHELLVKQAAARKPVASEQPEGAVKKASKKEPVMIDDAGLDKLAAALEMVAAGKLTPELSKQVLVKSAQVMRQVKVERAFLIEEQAKSLHKESASNLAKELVNRGIYSDEDIAGLVEKVAQLNNLDAVKKAVELVQPTAKKALPIGTVEKSAASGNSREAKLMEDPAIAFLMEHV